MRLRSTVTGFPGSRNASRLVAPDHLDGIGEAIVAELVAKRLLAELAGRGVRQFVDELDRVRQPPFGDMRGQMLADLDRADVAARRP